MKMIDEITALLPNRVSRIIAVATLILSSLCYKFCPDFFSLFPKLQESNKLLIRLLLTETIALFGLSLLITSLIFTAHKLTLSNKNKKVTATEQQIDELQKKVDQLTKENEELVDRLATSGGKKKLVEQVNDALSSVQKK